MHTVGGNTRGRRYRPRGWRDIITHTHRSPTASSKHQGLSPTAPRRSSPGKCHVNLSDHMQTDAWLDRTGEWEAAELRSKPTRLSGDDSAPHPAPSANTDTTSRKRPPWSESTSPRKETLSAENPQTRDPTLPTEQKACVPARGGGKERGKNLRGFPPPPRSAPKSAASAPGRFPSHPSGSRRGEERSGLRARQSAASARLPSTPPLPSPPPPKNKGRERKGKGGD